MDLYSPARAQRGREAGACAAPRATSEQHQGRGMRGEGPGQSTGARQTRGHHGSSAGTPSFPPREGAVEGGDLGGQKGKHHGCSLGPVQVFSLERVPEHQLTPSLCPTCQESQGGGEGRKIDLKGGEGHQYNRTFNREQVKAQQSLPSLPFLPRGSAEPAKSRQGAVRRGKGIATQAGLAASPTPHPHQSSHRPNNSRTPSDHRATQTDRPRHGPAQRGAPAARCSHERIARGRRRGWKAARSTQPPGEG